MLEPKIIRDTLPLTMSITQAEEYVARKHGLPVFKGVLYKMEKDDYGNDIFNKVNENVVVIGGAITALEYLFGNSPTFKPTTLNSIYNVNNGVTYNERDCTIKCWGVGTGGSGLDFGNPLDPDFKQREILDMIPFQVSDTTVLDAPNASKYFFRKKISDAPNLQYGWHLKEFENTVVPISRWKDVPDLTADGTEVTTEVYNSPNTSAIECYGEAIIKFQPSDVKSYFDWTGKLKEARFNSIGLFTGVKKLIDNDYYDYVGVRLFSVVNMDNVSVKMNTESTYMYRIYAAV